MYSYGRDYVLGYLDNEDDLYNHKGIIMLCYKGDEFLGGTVFSSDIPPSELIDYINIAQHTCEADKVTVILEDGRRATKVFTK